MYEWDDNEYPLAYLITIRTYGTWLHGDDRGSVDRHGKNRYGTEKIGSVPTLAAIMTNNADAAEFTLNGRQRNIVEAAIREVCRVREHNLIAINVRTNHVHAVVSARRSPEMLMSAFKANATRELRQQGLIGSKKVWSRGGSRRYLWKEKSVESAVEYVLYGQGDDLPNF